MAREDFKTNRRDGKKQGETLARETSKVKLEMGNELSLNDTIKKNGKGSTRNQFK